MSSWILLPHKELLDFKNLLNTIEKYPREKEHLVVGAVRYFVKSNDAQADLDTLLGFDDDTPFF